MSYNVLNAVCFIMFYQYMYRIAPSLSLFPSFSHL